MSVSGVHCAFRMRVFGPLLALALLSAPIMAFPSGHRGHSHSSSSAHHASNASGSHHRASGVARDKHGHIKRSHEARAEFVRSHPCPSTGKTRGACPGYVVDHVVPLKRGGADSPSNMQWQTTAEGKAKDKWE